MWPSLWSLHPSSWHWVGCSCSLWPCAFSPPTSLPHPPVAMRHWLVFLLFTWDAVLLTNKCQQEVGIVKTLWTKCPTHALYERGSFFPVGHTRWLVCGNQISRRRSLVLKFTFDYAGMPMPCGIVKCLRLWEAIVDTTFRPLKHLLLSLQWTCAALFLQPKTPNASTKFNIHYWILEEKKRYHFFWSWKRTFTHGPEKLFLTTINGSKLL